MIKHKYIETPIFICLDWHIEFHVHTYASLLVVDIMLAHNLTRKHDQHVVYASKFLNSVERNYIPQNVKPLLWYLHFITSNIAYCVISLCSMLTIWLWSILNKPHVLGRIAKWLFLFLEYEFTVVDKLRHTHVVVDAIFRLPNIIETKWSFVIITIGLFEGGLKDYL